MKLFLKDQGLYLIILINFIIRVLSIPFAQVVDADATTRVFISENWLNNPYIISEGVWPPFHFYFNGLAIALFGEHVIGTMLFHIILTCLTAIPLYHFTKREFSENGAWITVVFYLLCPVVFRNSFHTLSGLPHAFFIALALNSISKSIRNNDIKQAVYAGLFMTLAAGFRYEAWLLIALFTGIFILFKKWKYLLYFWPAAMIFPVFWMIGNYIAHEDIFYGLSGAYHWNITMEGVNDHIDKFEKVKRLIYFPLSWFFLFSPLLIGLVGWKLFQKIKTKELQWSRFIWSLPFFIVFFIFMYKALEGTLLLQHRFTISLILLSAPFTSLIIEKNNWTRLKKVILIVVLISMLPLSYFWMHLPFEKAFLFSNTVHNAFNEVRLNSQNSFGAIPRLSNQDYVRYSKNINAEITENSGLILDFVAWDNTFFLALNSELPPNQIFIIDGSKHGAVYKDELQKILENHPTGVIVLKCYSKFSDDYQVNGNFLTFNIDIPIILKLTPIDGEVGLDIFKYEKVTSLPEINENKNCTNCPDINSQAYYVIKISENETWLNDIKRKAKENNIPFEEQLLKDAQWMVDNP